MWLAHWFGSDWPAYAPGQGGSRRLRRDDSLSRLIAAPAPGGGRDDCFSRLLFWGGECEDDRDEMTLCLSYYFGIWLSIPEPVIVFNMTFFAPKFTLFVIMAKHFG